METEPDWDEEESEEVPEMQSIEEPGSGGQTVGSDGSAVTLRTVSHESEEQEEPSRIRIVDVTSVTGPSTPIPGVSVQPHAEGNIARGEFSRGVKVTSPGGANIFLLMGFQRLSFENRDS